jgi:hypothetical protein
MRVRSTTLMRCVLVGLQSSKSKMVKTSSMELLTIILQHWPIQKYARLTPVRAPGSAAA